MINQLRTWWCCCLRLLWWLLDLLWRIHSCTPAESTEWSALVLVCMMSLFHLMPCRKMTFFNWANNKREACHFILTYPYMRVIVKFSCINNCRVSIWSLDQIFIPSLSYKQDNCLMIIRKAYKRTSFTDRKSTRLNSSHTVISYAVFCLKKKKKNQYQK